MSEDQHLQDTPTKAMNLANFLFLPHAMQVEVEADLALTERSEFENLLSSFDLHLPASATNCALASLVNKLLRFSEEQLHISDLLVGSVVEYESEGEFNGVLGAH